MKKGVTKLTACCLAAGMTFTGTGSVAYAAKDTTLAGFGMTSIKEEKAPETEPQVIQGVETETVRNASSEEPVYEEQTAEDQAAEDPVYEEPAAEDQAAEDPVYEEPVYEEPVVDTSLSGQQAFAQCEDYINIRSSAGTDGEVVAKVYNNAAVTILSQVGDWYEVQSGNAVGYVKADYFAVGDAAQAIAEEVGYNVATVYPEALTVRSGASEDSEAIGTLYANDEIEVVDYSGDWMKVALGGDSYGYISAYYVGYDTYYATAETVEEEQARLDREWLDYLAAEEAKQAAAEQAYLDAIREQEQAAQQAAWDAEWQAQQNGGGSSTQYEEAQQQQWDAEWQAQDAQQQADNAYQQYLDAQQAADDATQYGDEQAVYDTAQQAQQAYQDYLDAQQVADQQQQAAWDAEYLAQQAQQNTQYTEDTSYTEDTTYTEDYSYTEENTYTEDTSYTEDTYYEESYTEESYSSTGQSIANYATQFVGNPYVWGGSSLTNGADCSGFTMAVYANYGVGLPHSAAAQASCGTPVSLSELQPGDLLFYEGGGGIGHVTMYIGGGQVVHASSSTTGIIISDIGYRTPCAARRYV